MRFLRFSARQERVARPGVRSRVMEERFGRRLDLPSSLRIATGGPKAMTDEIRCLRAEHPNLGSGRSNRASSASPGGGSCVARR